MTTADNYRFSIERDQGGVVVARSDHRPQWTAVLAVFTGEGEVKTTMSLTLSRAETVELANWLLSAAAKE